VKRARTHLGGARKPGCHQLVDQVEQALSSSRLPAHLLTLELTESGLLDAGHSAEEQLAALRLRGVRIALDDFGTGYASLAYLQRLPVDIVKIDRSYTAGIDTGESDVALLRGIISLGKALGLELLAEGIERPAQERIVTELGCDGAQGFHFGAPKAAEPASKAVERGDQIAVLS
jgi:EAL domain-containing protein (putative c-di-GMP-specific phosphodiesterase class I)